MTYKEPLFDTRNPPFAITHISPEPIIADSFMNVSLGWSYKVFDYIIFPMGFTFDEEYIHVSYGKNDKTGWILKLKKDEFLKSLKPVKTRVIGTSTWNATTGNVTRSSYTVVNTSHLFPSQTL